MHIREAKLEDAAAIAKVHVNSWQTTYGSLLSNEYIEKRSYEKRHNNWKKRLSHNTKVQTNYFIYVAENSVGEIVGFVDGGLAREDSTYKGEIYALYVLEAYQRKGISKSLIKAIASRLSQSGLTSIMVWVLENNPAVQFYQALGGRTIEQKLIKICGIEFTEIGYGWHDTKVLLTK
ncbi:MAG: GNAT family N-acetyltransferase [Pleurocapsa sp.]